MARTNSERSALREWAGVVAALIAVVAFVNIGYALILIEVFTGLKVSPPEAWESGMISLSSAALGFLIGKQSTAGASAGQDPSDPSPMPMPFFEPQSPASGGCGAPGCPMNRSTPPT